MADSDTNGKSSGRCPKTGRFLEGNPGGPGTPARPSLVKQMRKMLAEEPELVERIVRRWVDQAMERGGRDMSYLVDRVDGLMVQKVEGTVTRHTKRLGWAREIEDEEAGGEADAEE